MIFLTGFQNRYFSPGRSEESSSPFDSLSFVLFLLFFHRCHYIRSVSFFLSHLIPLPLYFLFFIFLFVLFLFLPSLPPFLPCHQPLFFLLPFLLLALPFLPLLILLFSLSPLRFFLSPPSSFVLLFLFQPLSLIRTPLLLLSYPHPKPRTPPPYPSLPRPPLPPYHSTPPPPPPAPPARPRPHLNPAAPGHKTNYVSAALLLPRLGSAWLGLEAGTSPINFRFMAGSGILVRALVAASDTGRELFCLIRNSSRPCLGFNARGGLWKCV